MRPAAPLTLGHGTSRIHHGMCTRSPDLRLCRQRGQLRAGRPRQGLLLPFARRGQHRVAGAGRQQTDQRGALPRQLPGGPRRRLRQVTGPRLQQRVQAGGQRGKPPRCQAARAILAGLS